MANIKGVWSEKGEADGFTYFVTKSGRVVGGPTVCKMARAMMLGFTSDEQGAVINATVRNAEWVRGFHGMTPMAVARSVEMAALSGAGAK
jgi:hypothetical protein